MGPGLQAVVLASLWLACPAVGQSGFEHVLPSDTLFFAGCTDVDALREAFLQSQLGALIGDPVNAELFERLGAGLQSIDGRVADLIGAGPLELARLVHGRLAIAAFGSPRGKQDSLSGVALALLADVDSKGPECVALADRLADGVGRALGQEPSRELVHEAGVRTIRSSATERGPGLRVRLALRGAMLILTVELLPMEQDALESLLDGLDRPPADALAESPRFRDTLAAGPGGGVQAWTDLDRLCSLFRQWHEASMWSLDYVQKQLGPMTLGPAALRADFGPTGLRLRVGIDWSASQSISAILQQFRRPESTRLLDYVPPDSSQASLGAVDPNGLLGAGLPWITGCGFATQEQIDLRLAQFEDLLGSPVDVLLDALDGEYAFITGHPGQEGSLPASLGSSHQLALLLGVKDMQVISDVAAALARSASPPGGGASFELEGTACFRVTVDTLKLEGAVLPNLLVVSTSEALLGDVLRAALAGRAGSLAGDAHVQERLAALSPGWRVLEYTDSAQQLGDLLDFLAKMRPAVLLMADHELAQWLGPLLSLPPLDVAAARRHLVGGQVTGTSVTDAGLHSETLMY